MRSKKQEKRTRSNRKGISKECMAAILLALICSVIAIGRMLLELDCKGYPTGTDAMGNMAKVQLLASTIKKGKIPSWFPYWYNGSSFTGAVTLLPYLFMVPFYLVFQNVMITYATYGFVTMWIGGIGIWNLSSCMTEKRVSLVAVLLYCMNPFYADSFYRNGNIDQTLMFAIVPWLLFSMIQLMRVQSKKRFYFVTFCSLCCVLCNIEQAFMIFLCGLLCIFVEVILKKRQFKNFAFVIVSILCGVLGSCFWTFESVMECDMSFSLKSMNYFVSFIAACIVITFAVLFQFAWKDGNYRRIRRFIALVFMIAIVFSLHLWNFQKYEPKASEDNKTVTQYMNQSGNVSEKGRLLWFGTEPSIQAYDSVQSGYFLSNGWKSNIKEETLDIRKLNYALNLGYLGYIEKQIKLWNVRAVLCNNNDGLENMLVENDFMGNVISEDQKLYVNYKPSSYCYLDTRNALLLDQPFSDIAFQYPFFVQGKSNCLLDYSFDELKQYALIYIKEPEINSAKEMRQLEQRMEQLIECGIQIVIEPKTIQRFQLFGVRTIDDIMDIWSNGESVMLEPTQLCTYESLSLLNYFRYQLGGIRSLYGLDEVYVEATQQNGEIRNAVIGAKHVGNGKIIFIGGHLSNYLQQVNIEDIAHSKDLDKTIETNHMMDQWFNELFDDTGVMKEYNPTEIYGVIREQFNDNGFTLEYNSKNEQSIIVSMTYSPRWRATLNGQKVKVEEREHLVYLNLPAGNHRVELTYENTVYGNLGILISNVTVILLILMAMSWERVLSIRDSLSRCLRSFLQLGDGQKE